MSIASIARRLRREDSGFVMVTAVILLAVMGTLMAVILSVSTHTNFATGRGKSWVQALHVGEAGVQEAISKLQATNGGYSGTFTGTTDEGSYSVTVAALTRNRFRIDATGDVLAGQGLSASRKLRITMAPPPMFKYALFSNTTIATKGGDVITGDVWANQNVIVEQGNVITGTITAATGYIYMKNGSTVSGDAWSGGFEPTAGEAIHLDGTAVIQGKARASVTAPTDPDTCGGESQSNYKVRLENGASIGQTLTTWGSKTGSGTVGVLPINENVCTSAPPTEPMPTYTYAPENYDPDVLHEFGTASTPSATAVDDFQAYLAAHSSSFSGVFFVNQSGAVNQDVRLDLTNVTITGDTTIVSNTPIFTNGLTDDTSDAIVNLVSFYQPPVGSSCELNQDNSECSVHLKNNFQATGNTAVLIYAPYGPVAIKNNEVQYGAIYSENIQIKNNQTMTYDSRIERVAGFGPVTYEVETWLECPLEGCS